MRALLAACALLWAAQSGAAETHTVTFHTAQGEQAFTAELAVTQEEAERGLMFRESLPERHGMLFIFEPPRKVTFWMKNTPLSLDLIFIGPDGVVTEIMEGLKPFSLDYNHSAQPAHAVLEVEAGSARRYHIAKGDAVDYPRGR